VVVVRESRLELCHPDEFHALRDVDMVTAAGDTQRYSSCNMVTSLAAVYTCSCDVSCCDERHCVTADDVVTDDVIPLPVHYVAARVDNDHYDNDQQHQQDDDDNDDDDDDDSACSDSHQHKPSKFLTSTTIAFSSTLIIKLRRCGRILHTKNSEQN